MNPSIPLHMSAALRRQSLPPFPRPSGDSTIPSDSRQRHGSNGRGVVATSQGLPSPPSDNGDLKTLTKLKSRYNDIQVLEVSRRANHRLAGARLLLLDGPGNIHSIIPFPHHNVTGASLTSSYLDAFATLPPLLPSGAPLALLGFGAGSAARLLLHHFPGVSLHGYELDPAVLSVSRDLLGLRELEELHVGSLVVRVGDALEAESEGGFAGMAVDLFSRGSVVRELQEEGTWAALRARVRAGGRVMVNCGGRSVESEEGEPRRSGAEVAGKTLEAMWEVFGHELMVLNVGDVIPGEDTRLAMTGGPVRDAEMWKRELPLELRGFVDSWRPYSHRH